MIAALASGVLTQLEGIGAISSSVANLLAPAASTKTSATCAAQPANGPCALQSFSDQLQALLLQQQSQPTGATNIQGDDLTNSAQVS